MRRCSVPGCERKHCALGLCEPHYRSSRSPEQRARHYSPHAKRGPLPGRTCVMCGMALDAEMRADARYCTLACRVRAQRLRSRFGVSTEWYREQLARQDGRCAVCHAPPPLHVDHDHSTGRARGLLCLACNVTLGNVKDDPMLLRALAGYLFDYA